DRTNGLVSSRGRTNLESGLFFDRCDKAVANARDGHNVAMLVLVFAERPPQKENVLREIAFFDKSIRPDAVDDVVLFGDLAVMLDQEQERLKDFGRKGDGLLAAQQEVPFQIYPERPEFVGCFRITHRSLRSYEKS